MMGFFGARVAHDRWIDPVRRCTGRSRRPVETRETIPGLDLPIVACAAAVMLNTREQAFRAGPIADETVAMLDRYEVFRAGQHKDIGFLIAGDLLRAVRHPRDANGPAQPEGAISVPGAIGQIELWLEAVAAGRNSDWNGEVSSPSMKIRTECLAKSLQRPSGLWHCNDVTRRCFCHRSDSSRTGGLTPAPFPSIRNQTRIPMRESAHVLFQKAERPGKKDAD